MNFLSKFKEGFDIGTRAYVSHFRTKSAAKEVYRKCEKAEKKEMKKEAKKAEKEARKK